MTKTIRKLQQIINAQSTSDGAGVKLKRSLNAEHKQALDPFLMLDEFGSDEAADYSAGFPKHPHRGFETVTYMLEGAMLHRDHMGNEGHLCAGSVQWMSAARGIIHSEMPEQDNGKMHGFQLWINLPAKEKMKDPRYQEYSAAEIPQVALANGGSAKIIAGDFVYAGQTVRGAVNNVSTQPLYFDVQIAAGQHFETAVDDQQTVMVYVYQGQLSVGIEQAVLQAGQLGKLDCGDSISLQATSDSRFLLLAATPIKESVVQYGPFVMNTQEEIEQAFRDYRDGVLTRI
jgi:redox-sensitive bicupin YhaK (pirin superfamily)